MHEELIELEHRGWEALTDGSAVEFYGRLLTEDAVMIWRVRNGPTTAEAAPGPRCRG